MTILLKKLSCVAAAALIAFCAGCNEKAPDLSTWPVRGKVVDKAGRPFNNGIVRFMTDADPHLITVGPLNAEGAFAMHTQRLQFRYDGAVEGNFRAVVYTAKQNPDGSKSIVHYRVPTRIVVKPQVNELEIAIPL